MTAVSPQTTCTTTAISVRRFVLWLVDWLYGTNPYRAELKALMNERDVYKRIAMSHEVRLPKQATTKKVLLLNWTWHGGRAACWDTFLAGVNAYRARCSTAAYFEVSWMWHNSQGGTFNEKGTPENWTTRTVVTKEDIDREIVTHLWKDVAALEGRMWAWMPEQAPKYHTVEIAVPTTVFREIPMDQAAFDAAVEVARLEKSDK